MKSGKALLFVTMALLLVGCGGGGGTSGTPTPTPSPTPTPTPSPTQVNNVMTITVNGSLCSAVNFFLNEPCVSVTICSAGTSNCQTIDNILLDTGSYGLRIFQQALSVPLTPVTIGSGSLAECIQFADGSSAWGPVQMANVILANEPAIQVPIQVIDSTFGSLPIGCLNADQIPADAGTNGFLGVGFFAQDCGSACSSYANNGIYYTCTGPSCAGTAVPLSSQVQNPVALLPVDNNGVIVQLPSVPSDGASSVNGSLVLGIGTQSNNALSSATIYNANDYGEFNTIFNNVSYSNSFLDTGSNGLFFPSPSVQQLPNCGDYPEWFCPPSTISLSAINTGTSGSPSGMVSFQIGNFDTLLTASSNNVFANIGGQQYGQFDWGLPFFLGRNVYVGMEGKGGPYWAY